MQGATLGTSLTSAHTRSRGASTSTVCSIFTLPSYSAVLDLDQPGDSRQPVLVVHVGVAAERAHLDRGHPLGMGGQKLARAGVPAETPQLRQDAPVEQLGVA